MGAYLFALWNILKLTFSKKPEMVEARKELKEHGQLIANHPAEYFGYVARQIEKAVVFLIILCVIIVLIVGHYDEKEMMRRAQEQRESMQAYQEHRKTTPPDQLCQQDKQAWDAISVEPPCTPEEFERWKEHHGLAAPCSSIYDFPECAGIAARNPQMH
jgi:hypothetical protein